MITSRISKTPQLLRQLGRLHSSSTAFFLCDIQEKFRPIVHHYDSLVGVAQKMSEASKLLNIPLIVTEQYPQGLGSTAQEIPIDHAQCVESKTKFSMMTDGVVKRLRDLNTKSVVLYGIESHVCVLQTCLDLLADEYDVHVLADGVSSTNGPEIQIALERMAKAGAHVVTSESVIFQLTGDAKHPEFKQVSGLVKKYQESSKNNKLLFKL